MDEARANILPRAGANAYDLGHATIDALPQGTNAPLDKVFLQLTGVSQDSIASGSFHIRNEHENVQYRINGVFLPPGVTANQLSPRASVTYKPMEGTVFHVAYARYFTPPNQVLAAPINLALVNNTTQQPDVNLNDPIRPQRSHYVDVG